MSLDRKNPIRLSNDQKYQIYTYAIENRCVYQNGAETNFRVMPSQIANELNLLGHVGAIINAHHVKEAIEMTISWQKRLDRLPSVPKETAEIEKLKIDHIEILKQVEQYKVLLAQEKSKNVTENIAASKLQRIKAILAA